MKILITVVLLSVLSSAFAMDKTNNARVGGENPRSRADVTGIPSPCADTDNNGINDCQEIMDKNKKPKSESSDKQGARQE